MEIFSGTYNNAIVSIKYINSGYSYSATIVSKKGHSITEDNSKNGLYNSEKECWRDINHFIEHYEDYEP